MGRPLRRRAPFGRTYRMGYRGGDTSIRRSSVEWAAWPWPLACRSTHGRRSAAALLSTVRRYCWPFASACHGAMAWLNLRRKELTFFYEIIFSGAIMNTTSGGVLLPIVSAACCSAGILQWFPALSFCYRFPFLPLCRSCSMTAWLMASNTSPHLYAISCLVVCTSSGLSGKWISSPSSINKWRGVSKISPWSPQFVYISFILFLSFYLAPAILRAPSSFLESNILAAGNNRRFLLPCDLEIKLLGESVLLLRPCSAAMNQKAYTPISPGPLSHHESV